MMFDKRMPQIHEPLIDTGKFFRCSLEECGDLPLEILGHQGINVPKHKTVRIPHGFRGASIRNRDIKRGASLDARAIEQRNGLRVPTITPFHNRLSPRKKLNIHKLRGIRKLDRTKSVIVAPCGVGLTDDPMARMNRIR
jgi:hypothetical protein